MTRFTDASYARNFLKFEVSQGLEILDSTDYTPPPNNLSRSGGRSHFTKMTLDYSRTQPFPNNIALVTSAKGQWVANQVLASEEISFGGRQFGRGYDSSEISGDYGFAGAFELNYTGDAIPDTPINQYQFYGFYDVGTVFAYANDQIDKRKTATSGGFGLRLFLEHDISAFLEFAKPLTRSAASRGGKDKRDAQVLFNLGLSF
jgi:hemolysin activation/secretion protein